MSTPKKKLTRRDLLIGIGIILGAAAATGGLGLILVLYGG